MASNNSLLRFNLFHRFNHFLIIISFFGLVLTGMPLVFKDYGWALYLYNLLGGYPTAGNIHRICALITFFAAFLHFAFLTFEAVVKKNRGLFWGPNSLLIQPRDVLNILGDVLWFFRLGPRPKFDRWIYWEKFEYLSLMWGTLVMGATGFILWFPVQSTSILPANIAGIIDLPSIALVAHRYEALLAAGFIFTIHFFHTHMLPENIPVDEAMFTGRVPEEHVIHERGTYYERLKNEDKLEECKVKPASSGAKFVSKMFGIPILIIGLLMVSFMLSSLIFSLIP
jgi:cytochrome b subunit of formate dehydrogenase